MMMSRAEIEAAAIAVQASRRSVRWDSAARDASREPARALAARCARRLDPEPWYRTALVAELRCLVAARAYHRPAAAIVEQLFGRLTAGALND